ncbi:MAG: C_GCAxxG_C_C family protein [Ruminococcaceae bacterium]|nr:C_GCAxxG_C_C family protein [Oscillospiraceae bacterium]
MDKMEHAKQLRAITETHYNCAQSVLVPFAREMGMSEEQACALGAHFGSGMRHGSTCGALTGALMVLGAMGCGEEEARAMLQSFREKNGCTDCAHLLAAAKERGEEKKPHCDRLVCECVQGLLDLTTK